MHNHVCFVKVEEDVVLTSKPNAFDTIYAEVLQECKTYDASRQKRLSRQQLTRISQNSNDSRNPKFLDYWYKYRNSCADNSHNMTQTCDLAEIHTTDLPNHGIHKDICNAQTSKSVLIKLNDFI